MSDNLIVYWGSHVYDNVIVDQFATHGGSHVTVNNLNARDIQVDNGSSVTVNGLATVISKIDVEGGSQIKFNAGLVVLSNNLHIGNGSHVIIKGPLAIDGIDMSMVEDWRTYVKVDPGSSVEWIPTPPACFLAGTMIRMADGTDKAVEDVRVGDMVMTHNTRKH